jgi:hypothetical protein
VEVKFERQIRAMRSAAKNNALFLRCPKLVNKKEKIRKGREKIKHSLIVMLTAKRKDFTVSGKIGPKTTEKISTARSCRGSLKSLIFTAMGGISTWLLCFKEPIHF